MRESGGRRIKRSISVSMRSIKFADRELLDRLKTVTLIQDFVESIIQTSSNASGLTINSSKTTNISLFRNYLHAFLKKNKSIHKHGFDFLVRELQPSDGGLPIEVYVFSNSLDLESYENIQAEIFDHIIASLKFFDLDVFQKL
jgi:miniconductance mechanosensitive channel